MIEPLNTETATYLEPFTRHYKPCTNQQHILELDNHGKITDILTIRQFLQINGS